jgi:2-haloacid dehalogenase
VYGTLVDPVDLRFALTPVFGRQAMQVANDWRRAQLEYTFRLAAMGGYLDFEAVTQAALAQVAAERAVRLGDKELRNLAGAFDSLKPRPGVVSAFGALRQAGWSLSVFSNGTPRMLAELLKQAGLSPFVDQVVSVDGARSYKPAPAVYGHLLTTLGLGAANTFLVSCNAFDVQGALSAGLRAVWITGQSSAGDRLMEVGGYEVISVPDIADLYSALRVESPKSSLGE